MPRMPLLRLSTASTCSMAHAHGALHDQGNGRVDVAAARAHDQALQRREAHGGVDGDAVLDGGHRGAVAQVAGDDLQLFQLLAHGLGPLLGHVEVRGAVEAVAADLVLAVVFVGQGVDVGLFGHGLVKGGVEDPGHGDAGQDLLAGLDAGDVGRVVQRRQRDALLEGGEHGLGDGHGAVELLAGVHHAVADGEDLAFVLDDAGLGVGEVADDQLDAVLVVGDVAGDDVLLLALVVVQHRALDADPLQQALGQDLAGLHVDQLEFDRRTAAVDDQNFHCALFCRRIFNFNYNAFPPKINKKIIFLTLLRAPLTPVSVSARIDQGN